MTKSPIQWFDCYGESWTGIIVPDAFSHPAKFSKALIEHIYAHMESRGWIEAGDVIGDPFGGVGLGGIIGAYLGYRWIGVELEKKFCSLARRNFALHQSKWKRLGVPRPVIVQGDSRQFARIVGQVTATITSPPWVQIGVKDHGGQTDALKGGRFKGGGDRFLDADYGSTPGQIGQLRGGSLDAVLSSPPYADSVRDFHGHTKPESVLKAWFQNYRKQGGGMGYERFKEHVGSDRRLGMTDYGQTTGQIGALKSGQLDAAVTSPPWEKNCEGSRKGHKLRDPLKCNRGHGASDAAVLAQAKRDEQKVYGESPGNIGNTEKETYWQAMSQVYSQMFQAIKAGGYAAIVVKDYVRDRNIVPLCDDTARLLEHCGFTMVERIHAMLVQEDSHADLFGGQHVRKRQRKSFFRRIAEAKGSPAVDWEEVIFVRKP